MGWLSKFTDWLVQLLKDWWADIAEFFGDLLVRLVKTVLDLALAVIDWIPVPDFISNYSLGSILGNAGPTVQWLNGTFKIGEGLAIIGAAYAFRLLRKLVTLGQW